MDKDGSVFAGDKDFMVLLQTDVSHDAVTSQSSHSIQRWLDGVQQASPTTNLHFSQQLTETSTSCHTTCSAAQLQMSAGLKGV
jgi:hypothetical protein